MSIVSTTTTINAAFLQEIKEDHRELWQLLAEAEAWCRQHAGHSVRQAVDVFTKLRDQLGMHFALEEAFGYFDDPLQAAPRLCCKADDLRGQHAGLFLSMCDLVDQAEQMLYHEGEAGSRRKLAHSFHQFHRLLSEHEAQENELILQALDDDIGVGD